MRSRQELKLFLSCLLFFLQQQGGTLSLIECTLIEELDASDEDC